MKPALLIALAALLALGAFLLVKRHNSAVAALPPARTVSLAEVQWLLVGGADLVAVRGTGSMQPYIPASDSPTDIVAYVSVERAAYADLRKHDLVVYRAATSNVLHQLDSRDGDSWVASGLHNSGYDRTRVSAGNYIGRVVSTYILK